MSDKTNDIPRRARVDQLTPAEAAIRNAVQAVEDAGGSPRLTEAVNLLGKARDLVADHVDDVPVLPPTDSDEVVLTTSAGILEWLKWAIMGAQRGRSSVQEYQGGLGLIRQIDDILTRKVENGNKQSGSAG